MLIFLIFNFLNENYLNSSRMKEWCLKVSSTTQNNCIFFLQNNPLCTLAARPPYVRHALENLFDVLKMM